MTGSVVRRFALPLLIVLVILSGGSVYAQCDPMEVQKVLGSDSTADDWFGTSVAISGDTVLVGAWLDDDQGENSGAVFIYRLIKGSWTETGKLQRSDGGDSDWFGQSVSMSGDFAIVGAPGANAITTESGAAYLYARDEGGSNNWGLVKRLTADDADTQDRLGYSVSISGDTVIAGAYWDEENDDQSGSAYVFQRDHGGPDNWGQVAKISASDGAAVDRFGTSVGIDGDTAIVGAPLHNDGAIDAGSAYIYERNQGGADNWGEVAELTAADPALVDKFGEGVSISGDFVAIGAPWDDDFGSLAGTAHVYGRNQGGADNWGHVAELIRSDPTDIDFFARYISIEGDIVLVGSTGDDDNGLSAGAAYVFLRDEGGADNWGQAAKITASDAQAEDFFGSSVTIQDGLAAVGAEGDDDRADHAGSAYIVDLNCVSACTWDLDGNDIVGLSDLLSLLASWGSCKGCPADFDGSGDVGVSDLLELLANWGPCP